MFTHSHLAHTLMNNFHWPRAATWTSTCCSNTYLAHTPIHDLRRPTPRAATWTSTCCLNTSLAHTPTNDLRWPTSRAATWTSTCGLKRTSVTCSPTGSSLQTRSPPHCLCTNGGCASCMHHVALCVHAMEFPPLLVYKWWVCFMHSSQWSMCPFNGLVFKWWVCFMRLSQCLMCRAMEIPPLLVYKWWDFYRGSASCMHHVAVCVHAMEISPLPVLIWWVCFFAFITVLYVSMQAKYHHRLCSNGCSAFIRTPQCCPCTCMVYSAVCMHSFAQVDRLVCLSTSGTCRAHMLTAWCACQPLAHVERTCRALGVLVNLWPCDSHVLLTKSP